MPGTALDGLAEAIRALVPESGDLHRSADTLRSDPGSYLLLLELQTPLAARIGNRIVDLAAGLYVYAGSARGPGGLRARLGRHLRGDGKKRWHIDQVTAYANGRAAFGYSGLSECGLIDRLSSSGRFLLPAAGFGSSDCSTCQSHFLQFVPDGTG